MNRPTALSLLVAALFACSSDPPSTTLDATVDLGAPDRAVTEAGAPDLVADDTPAGDGGTTTPPDGPCRCAVPNAEGVCGPDGRCVVGRCVDGWSDCNGVASDGCEVNVQHDTAHCGACRTPCADPSTATSVCRAGRCQIGVCAGGHADCDGDAMNGCEVDTDADTAHCGACGTACEAPANAAARCTGGACGFVCLRGFADCDNDPANGCEVEVSASASHCGACGRACTAAGATPVCVNGRCQLGACDRSRANCDGAAANGCEVNLRDDDAHCGACGTRCPTGETCNDGRCAPPCPAGQLRCGMACVVSASDPAHCGGCGQACPAGQLCSAGACVGVCASPRTSCGGSCADLTTDAAHCGACNTRCGAGQTCVAGRCTCPMGQLACASGCVDANVDVDNCGACRLRCPTGNGCMRGICIPMCPVGQTACGTQCVDTRTDPQHCGACGRTCPTGCVAGACARVADVELSDLNTFVRYTSGRAFGFGSASNALAGAAGRQHFPAPIQLIDAMRRPLEAIRVLRAGRNQGCAVSADDRLYCWGTNIGTPQEITTESMVLDADSITDGQWYVVTRGGDLRALGNPGLSAPRVVGNVAGPAELRAGTGFACVRRTNGAVHCAGSNNLGQLGDGSTTNRAAPVPVMGLADAVSLAAGDNHACAARANGAVVCWGSNTVGQLGDGTTTNRSSPVTVAGVTGAVAVAAGPSHTCALNSAGEVRCWGANGSAQTGNGAPSPSVPTAARVPMLGAARAIGAGAGHSCALLRDDSLWCWGDNTWGQAGGGTEMRNTPVRINGLTNVVDVQGESPADTTSNRCALQGDGTVHCWSAVSGNSTGTLGDGTTRPRLTPAPVPGLSNVTQIAHGTQHVCARLRDGTARCWGFGGSGALGDGGTTDRPSPVTVRASATADFTDIAELYASTNFTCARRNDRSVWCWGSNVFGQVGDGTYTNRVYPTQVMQSPGTPLRADQLAINLGSACARLTDGAVWCWGRNLSSELARCHTRNEPSAVPVLGVCGASPTPATGITALRCESGTCFATMGGRAVLWGAGNDRVVSDSLNRVTLRATGIYTWSTCVVTATDDAVQCAVRTSIANEWGDVGPMVTTGSFTTGSYWVVDRGYRAVTRGADAMPCAIHTSGELRCWGRTHNGFLAAAGLDALTRAPARIQLP